MNSGKRTQEFGNYRTKNCKEVRRNEEYKINAYFLAARTVVASALQVNQFFPASSVRKADTSSIQGVTGRYFTKAYAFAEAQSLKLSLSSGHLLVSEVFVG
jgi:hypothetical protein